MPSAGQPALSQPGRWPLSRGDWLGPLTAALVSLPIEVNYGIIAFAPLGPQSMVLGVLAALYCAIFANLAAFLAGTRTGLLAGTRPTLTLTVAVLIGQLMQRFQLDNGADVPLILALMSLTIMLAGLIQLLMGFLRVGRVFKYLPYPVLAGFVNGAALLIFLSALRPFIGLPNTASLAGYDDQLWHAPLGGLIVATVSLVLVLRPPRFTSKLPPLLVAILVGTLLHHLLARVFPGLSMGGMLSAVTPQWPDPTRVVEALRFVATEGFGALLPTALTLALLATVETMLTTSVVEGRLNTGRQSADRELMAQGIANLASGCFGGLPSAAGVSRCTNSINGGARSRLAILVYLLIAGIALLGAEWFGVFPLAMTGGVMVAVAWNMVDEWSRSVPRQLTYRQGLTRSQRKTLLANYLVMLTVVATAVIANLVTAVFVGVLGAMLLFVRQNSRNIIRRQLQGDQVHSHRQRSISRMRELEREGHRIILLELEGALFFGTADKLVREVELLAKHADYLILDFLRVTDIDITGARILQQAVRMAQDRRCQLLFASIQLDGARGRILLNSTQILAPRFWFDDVDAALEWAEDALLEKFDLPEQLDRRLGIEETQLGRGLTREERTQLQPHLEEIFVTRDAPLFRSGDPADGLFVLVSGSVSITLNGEHGRRRVASFAPGVTFGEMGLLDGMPRSADVYADDVAVVLKLGRDSFEQVRAEHPDLAAKLLFNLGVEMATRLRYANQNLISGEVVDIQSA